MKKLIIGSFVVVAMLAFMVTQAQAGKKRDDSGEFLGNGFPSGKHHNLNIIAKKANFVCPDQEYLCPDGETVVTDCNDCINGGACTPVYGGVIFVPQVLPQGDKITILMESGKKGPKGNPGAIALEVTDWCTETFDDDAAAFRLPKNDEGYAVYARVTGDPKQNPQFEFTDPRLKYVMDDKGNELILLGFIDGAMIYDSNGVLLRTRYDKFGQGKGVQKALRITPFFWWTGNVCYIFDPVNPDLDPDFVEYCCVDENENGECDDGEEVLCTETEYCCLDADADPFDYERCGPLTPDCDECVARDPVDLCCVDIDVDTDDIYDPDYEYCDLLADTVCPDFYPYFGEEIPYHEVLDVESECVTAWCRSYADEWVFNIADFVGLLWDIESDPSNPGASVIQVRFYPLPLNEHEQ